MEWHEYWRRWLKRAFSGGLLKAELFTGLASLGLAPIAFWWEPWGEVMSWLPSIIFLLLFVGLVAYGLIRAPYWIYKELEEEHLTLKKRFVEADRINLVIEHLIRLRKRGVIIRNMEISLSQYQKWKKLTDAWSIFVIKHVKELSNVDAAKLETLDQMNPWAPVCQIDSPEYVLNNRVLSERLFRLVGVMDSWSKKARLLSESKER